jgi:GMP synthase (glutamine-hydrolysing)
VALLKSIDPDLDCDITCIADVDEPIPARETLGDFRGVLWTGTPLSVMDDVPGMRRQLDFMKTVFDAGLPVLGICGGLQVGVAVAGGKVTRNPKGLESGVARRIQITDAGREHPLFQYRDGPFDALCDHFDSAQSLPAGAQVLAFNEACPVQAVAFRAGESDFWGVQYHPDFTLSHLRAISELRAGDWLQAGLVRDAADVEFIRRTATRLEQDAQDRSAAWLLGLDAAILDPQARVAEVRAWVEHVMPT